MRERRSEQPTGQKSVVVAVVVVVVMVSVNVCLCKCVSSEKTKIHALSKVLFGSQDLEVP